MSKTLIVGNWKMNLNVSAASLLVQRLHENIDIHRDIEIVLAPTLLTLQPISIEIDHRKFNLAAQDAFYVDEGAYTGQVSFTMLRGLVKYVIIGHSEKRHIFNESNDSICAKIKAAFRNGIIPILCVGETQIERLDGETNQVLHDQINTAVADITEEEADKLVIAYEPVWAIGSGEAATPRQAGEASSVIRKIIASLFNPSVADQIRVLYGGSVTPDLTPGFLQTKGINGLLVGGASLNYKQFSGIIDAAYRIKHGLKPKGGY